jgi:hypothetical protein
MRVLLSLVISCNVVLGCSNSARGSGAAIDIDEISVTDLFEQIRACKNSGGEPPAHRAELAEQAARAKMQRYPFEPRDGLQAVTLLREAALCWKAAGQQLPVTRVERQAESWRNGIWQDFQTHRLRLDLAIESQQLARALAEVRALQALWPRKTDAIAIELRRQESRLEGKIAEKKGFR